MLAVVVPDGDRRARPAGLLLSKEAATAIVNGRRQAIIGINLLALLALHFEIVAFPAAIYLGLFRDRTAEHRHGASITYSAGWMAYGSALMLIASGSGRIPALAGDCAAALTVIKVFLFDIAHCNAAIASPRLSARPILLAVSFFYQRSRLQTIE